MAKKNINLASPGAGLPLFELLVIRFILKPFSYRKSNWDKSLERFKVEGDRMIALGESVEMKIRTEPVLIRRMVGIEDSSRNWSLAMTLEHTTIVAREVYQVVLALSRGVSPQGKANTAAVKPKGELDWDECVQEWRKVSELIVKELRSSDIVRSSKCTFKHPWFGAMNIQEWVWMLGVHQTLHRRQMLKIIEEKVGRVPG